MAEYPDLRRGTRKDVIILAAILPNVTMHLLTIKKLGTKRRPNSCKRSRLLWRKRGGTSRRTFQTNSSALMIRSGFFFALPDLFEGKRVPRNRESLECV